MIEVAAAITIFALVVTAAYASFISAMRTKQYVEDHAEKYHAARLALHRISRDLSSAFLVTTRRDAWPLFSGEDNASEGRPMDRLLFTSFSHVKYVKDADESDQCEVEYYGDLDQESDFYNLYRRESKRIDDKPEESEEKDTLLFIENILGFDLEYMNEDGEWKEDWDSDSLQQANKIPVAVKITLILPRPEEGEESYATIVNIPKIKR